MSRRDPNGERVTEAISCLAQIALVLALVGAVVLMAVLLA